MPYRCVHCSEIHEDGAKEVLTGCKNCGSKFFFYIKEEKLKQIMKNEAEEAEDSLLTPVEKKQMEKEVREIAGIKDAETPVFLDFESVTVVKPGKYMIDIGKLFELKKPRIYKLEDGKYIIDLTNMVKAVKEK